MYASDRMAQWDKMSAELVGTLEAKKSLLYGNSEVAELVQHSNCYFRYQQPDGLYGLQSKHGYSGVFVPGEYYTFLYMCNSRIVRFVSIPTE